MKKGLVKVLITFVIVLLFTQTKLVQAENEKPRIVLQSYDVENDAITPGEQVVLNLTFANKDKRVGVSSILITLSNLEKKLFPVYKESDQIYIDYIGAGGTVSKKITLDSAKDFESSTTTIRFDILYTDGTGASYTNATNIQLPIYYQASLSIPSYSFQETAVVGAKIRFNATYENQGNNTLYNITMNINGDGLTKATKLNLNSLAGGIKSYAESYLEFLTVGEHEVDVNFTYEDDEGTTYVTDTQTFKIQVGDESIAEHDMSQTQVVNGSGNWEQYGQIGILIAIFILFVIVIILARKNRN